MKFRHLILGEVTLANADDERLFVDGNGEDFVSVIDSRGDFTTARVRALTPIEEVVIPESHRSLNTLADEILEVNTSKGFSPFDQEPNIDQMLLLIVGEIVEAQEELRAGHDVHEVYYEQYKLPSSLVAEVGVTEAQRLINEMNEGQLQKPEGFGVEIADALIRILHLCARLELDIDALVRDKIEYNKTRPFRHGKVF